MIGSQFSMFASQVLNPSEADFAVGGIVNTFWTTWNILKLYETMTL